MGCMLDSLLLRGLKNGKVSVLTLCPGQGAVDALVVADWKLGL